MIFMTDWHGSTCCSLIVGGARLMHGHFSKILGAQDRRPTKSVLLPHWWVIHDVHANCVLSVSLSLLVTHHFLTVSIHEVIVHVVILTRVGIVGGGVPSSCLQTLIFEWKSAINFNPWAKFQTFRQLTPSVLLGQFQHWFWLRSRTSSALQSCHGVEIRLAESCSWSWVLSRSCPLLWLLHVFYHYLKLKLTKVYF